MADTDLPTYVEQLKALRRRARTPAARSHLDGLIQRYQDSEWVRTHMDEGVPIDYLRPRRAEEVALPPPPAFIDTTAVGRRAVAAPPVGGTAPARANEAGVLAYAREPLERLESILLGPAPQEYFHKGPGGGAAPPLDGGGENDRS